MPCRCAGPTRGAELPEQQTFVLADLAGYTALTEAHGDDRAADVAADFVRSVRQLLTDYDAEAVKALGDALLLRMSSASSAIDLARKIVCEVGSRHRNLGVRIGVHTGTAVQRDGDWFGSAVNVAARVADVAGAGEVLVTEATVQAAGSGIAVRPRGRRQLKNVRDPIELYALVLDDALPAQPLALDPVCHMALDPGRTTEHATYRGRTYVFCSSDCAEQFSASPATYARRPSQRDQLLVSDQARERAAATLRRAYRQGRLDEQQLELRLEHLWVARTRADLRALTNDLPRPGRRRRARLIPWRWKRRG